jgi:hypothetical protein
MLHGFIAYAVLARAVSDLHLDKVALSRAASRFAGWDGDPRLGAAPSVTIAIEAHRTMSGIARLESRVRRGDAIVTAMPNALARVDPGLRNLRLALLAMAATLLSYGSALALKHAEHLSLSVVVLAVVLSLSLSRTDHASARKERLVAIVLLPIVAVAASEVGTLLAEQATLGDALYVAAVSGAIWLRRFGRNLARAGTLITLPFVAMLITPAVPGVGQHSVAWAAAAGLIAYLWVAVVHTAAQRAGFSAAPAPAPHTPSRARADTAARPATRRLAASTRMAIQMAAALAAAFAVGRVLFGVHWSWLVLTAFIVCSGNRGRGDVVYKSALRIAGAATGTIAATLLARAFAPGDVASVIVIFSVIGLATWLRSISYAFWAAGVTSVLALLYGYFGQTGTTLLGQRLEGIAIGAAIAIAASWFILPIRTTDVVRRRAADALAALSEVLAAIAATPTDLQAPAHRFEHAVDQLDQIAKPLEAHRLLSRPLRTGPHAADAFAAARSARASVREIVEATAAEPAALREPAVAARTAAIQQSVRRARQAIGGRPLDPPAVGGHETQAPVSRSKLEHALAELDAAVTSFTGSAIASLRRPA